MTTAAQAKAKALKALAAAQELEQVEKAQAEERQKEAERQRYELELARRDEYREKYIAPLRELRANFIEAIKNGQAGQQEYIDWQAAIQVAANEMRRSRSYFTNHHNTRAEQLSSTVRNLADELHRYRGLNSDGTDSQPDPSYENEPARPQSFPEHVQEILEHSDHYKKITPRTRLEQINHTLNSLAQALGSSTARDLRSVEWLSTADIIPETYWAVSSFLDRLLGFSNSLGRLG